MSMSFKFYTVKILTIFEPEKFFVLKNVKQLVYFSVFNMSMSFKFYTVKLLIIFEPEKFFVLKDIKYYVKFCRLIFGHSIAL